jgi:hypothetical protein
VLDNKLVKYGKHMPDHLVMLMGSLKILSAPFFAILLALIIILTGYSAYSYGQQGALNANYQSLLANHSALQDQYQSLMAIYGRSNATITELQQSCQNLTDIVDLRKITLIDSVQTWVPYHHTELFEYQIPYAGYLNITFEANKAVIFRIYGENSTYLVRYPQWEAGLLAGQFIAPVLPGNVTIEIRQDIGDMWHIDYNCTYVY